MTQPDCAVCHAFRRIMRAELTKRYRILRRPAVIRQLQALRAQHQPACKAVARVSV